MCLQTQNEPQAYVPFISDPNWICRRGTAIRPHLSNGVLLFSGKQGRPVHASQGVGLITPGA